MVSRYEINSVTCALLYILSLTLPIYPHSHYYSFPGSAVLDNGCKYEGTFQYGLMHGKGKFFWSDGVEYEGNFNRGKVLLLSRVEVIQHFHQQSDFII